MRGYQKKVIYMKNTGSPMFCEAYFVLSENSEKSQHNKLDMISEANRIIEENFGKKKNIFNKRNLFYVAAFLAGAGITLLAFLIL